MYANHILYKKGFNLICLINYLILCILSGSKRNPQSNDVFKKISSDPRITKEEMRIIHFTFYFAKLLKNEKLNGNEVSRYMTLEFILKNAVNGFLSFILPHILCIRYIM